MLLDAIRELDLDPARSVAFGDKRSDLEAAEAAGVKERVLLGLNGNAAPDPTSAKGLATASFTSLDLAVQELAPRLNALAAHRTPA
jgi:D-glycero-D-manno-heptose 1,7-bisphosphate phosphatase